MSNDLTPINFSIAPLEGGQEIAQAISEDVGALGPLELPRVKMPSGGTPMYTILRGKEDEDPEMVKSLDAIIIHQHPAYAYWADPASLGGALPDCSSVDGENGRLSAPLGGETVRCAGCPYNQYGSEIRPDGSRGRGKACKNGHRLYLLRSGEYIPTVMTVPPTGLRAYKTYLQSLLIPKGKEAPMRRYWQVVTAIGLKQAKNADGTAYCAPTFALRQALSAETAAAVKAYGEAFASSQAGVVAAFEAELGL